MKAGIAFIFALLDFAWIGRSSSVPVISEDRCTTIVVGSKAGLDGPMTTHTSDCSNCDFRIAKVPAKDWTPGYQQFDEALEDYLKKLTDKSLCRGEVVDKASCRPLYLYKGSYPSTVSSDRGQTWLPSNLQGSPDQLAAWGDESIITGYIPQVEHTFALYEAGYGIMNEHQVAIGESTCASRFWAAPTVAGGKAMIEVREMSRIALERTKTAREAIMLMGTLATQYGFYAADWSGGDASKGEGGEALTVIDKTEAWVFHVLADDTGTSAIWVAQRVPDDNVAAVANQFVIRHVDPDSSDFLYSANLWEVAEKHGLWSKEQGHLDFLATYGVPRAHSPYCTRRVWRVFNLVAPSIELPPFTDPFGSDYPFSIKADSVLSAADIMRIQRDHYEGTIFDLTQGIAAGPYGDPNRFDMAAQPADNLTITDIIQGSYERSISLFRTSYSFVATARAAVPDQLALLWFSQYAPSSSSYTPLYLASENAPLPLSRGSLFKYDPLVSFWNFCAAGNYAARFYKFAMVDVAELQQELQVKSFEGVASVDEQVKKLIAATTVSTPAGPIFTGAAAVVAAVTAFTNEQSVAITLAWQQLLPQLITKYHDGYRAENLDGSEISMHKLFYPKWWLDLTGYFKSKINSGPGVILFAPGPDGKKGSDATVAALLASALLSGMFALVLGFYIGTKWRHSGPTLGLGRVPGGAPRREYTSIDL